MPKSTYVQKTREFEYQKVGKNPGKSQYKLVAVAPAAKKSLPNTNLPDPQPLPALDPPTSSTADDDIQDFPDPLNESGDGNPQKGGKKQSEYMRQWLEEKRALYVNQLLQMKSGPNSDASGGHPQTCPKCRLGRPKWRCLDCVDSTALCVLCCRDGHQLNLFHRIEKWNGRFYQKAALWQVGVKIFTGHHGAPCPRSAAALTHVAPGFQDSIRLKAVWEKMRTTEMEVRTAISDAINGGLTNLTEVQKSIINHIADASGQTQGEAVSHLRAAAYQGAEDQAEQIQAASNRASAKAEAAEPPPNAGQVNVAEVLIENPLDNETWADDDWEDEDDRPVKGDLPRFLPHPPPSDSAGNEFLTIAHTNGFHSLPVVWCACSDHLNDRDIQLLKLRLYPASYQRIKTAFSFACLDDFRFESLECKSSHYQYHNKLRRLTCPQYPNASPNRYAELCRVSRQWRNLKHRRWFWKLSNENAGRGEMAIFCAACPQPGVNLEENWKVEYEQSPSLYMRSFVADGNFKADHLKQKNDSSDVWLTSGEGFMTNVDRYASHLADATESKTTPTCHRHRAQLNGEAAHNSADISGIGGHSCARHGCFAPGSLVNFQKGERQMNIDWSLCEALLTTNIGDIREILHIYDINCQYCRWLLRRILESRHLYIPAHIQLLHAIGQFHVHGHKDECLYRWATNYVPGAGVIDGEVMETLWAVLNSVAASTRTASLAHRTEVLDDHMSDSNWKKMLHIVKAIIGRYRRAVENVSDAREALERLTSAAPMHCIEEWTASIETAEANRCTDPAAMDIMHSRIQAGQSLKDIQAAMLKADRLNGLTQNADGYLDWLLEGLNIEDEQIRLRQQVRSAGSQPQADEKIDIERKRQRISNRIRDFHTTSSRLLGVDIVSALIGKPAQLNGDGYLSDDMRRPEDRGIKPIMSEIENTLLAFPSAFSGPNYSEAVMDFKRRELPLRRAKANDMLSHVRESLSGLSYQYINKVRQASTSKEHLRSFEGIKLLTKEVSFYQQVYNRSSQALANLDPEMKLRYPTLRRKECTISAAISDVNARGQSQVRLPWFWAALDGWDGENTMVHQNLLDNDRLLEFYRVSWLRARAQRNRWEEELPRTRKEMVWTTLFFMNQRNKWYSRLRLLRENRSHTFGHDAYCEQMISQWEELGRIADIQFRAANAEFSPTWIPIVTPM